MANDPSIIPINIEDEIRNSYLDYAMSVIIGRALPDVRDGLKPVHRRVLYAQHELGNRWNAAYKKSARVVGDVIGKYHPHGDSAVYDALVRLAQPWNMRQPLIDGQGNFGSVDGDAAAAMRYTEVRMSRISSEFLGDIDKDTVDWGPNYDDTLKEPLVLPTRVPNLLVNGSSGIAVGMSTNIPPHNLGEVVTATIALIDNPELTVMDILKIIPGPDFPTAGIIHGAAGIKSAYETGRGIIKMRARVEVETNKKGKEKIIVTELPYQVNKARLLEKIADLVRDKRLEGITDLRDESDRTGMRMVIELRRDAVAEVVINNLYKMTAMQSSFGTIMLAIVNGQPRIMPIKEVINHFIDFRRDVVTRRTIFELDQALARAHILEGLKIALDNIDAVIALIRASADGAIAKAGLIETFELSERQAQAILDMRLQRLTGLERDKIIAELNTIMEEIGRLRAILADETKLMALIREELIVVREQYTDERRTEINYNVVELGMEDFIAEETNVVTITHAGYVKRVPIDDYRAQRRGGRGRRGMTTKDDDFVIDLFVASTHDSILFFTTKGKVYKRKVYELPIGTPTTKGKPFVQFLPFAEDEKVKAVLRIDAFEEGKYVVTATKKGVIKRTELIQYQNVHTSGIIALGLKEGDELETVKLTTEGDSIFLASRFGQSIRFEQGAARAMGRSAAGVFGMRFKSDEDVLVSMDVIPNDTEMSILTITENGYGKRTDPSEHGIQGRGGTGMIAIKIGERNGNVVGSKLVGENDEIIIITNEGQIIRTRVSEISVYGRNTQGVRIMNTGDEEKIVGFARIAEEDISDDEEDVAGTDEENTADTDAPPAVGENVDPSEIETAEIARSDEEE